MTRDLNWITGVLIAGWIAISAAVYWFGPPDQQSTVVKVWEIIITLVVGFWFGSSAGKGRDINGEAANPPPQSEERE